MMEVAHRIIGGMKNSFEAHGGRYNRLNSYISRNSNFRKFTYISSAILSLLILATLCPIYLVPDVSEAATHDATPATLTFASIRNTASVSFNVSSTAGTFATSESNETASFSLSTNNATGYTLTLRTSDSTTSLSYGANSISTINGSKTSSDFAVNTWGLLPSKYNSTANAANYYPASSTGFTIEETNTANSSNGIDNPNTYTIGLGIKADYTIPAGTYTNTTIVAEYVANPITYAIYYYSNTTDTVTGMPATNPQVPASAFPGTTSTTVNLASAPTRTGYTFLGWCLGTSSSSNITVGTNGNADTCGNSSANQFTAGQSFGINATGSSPDLYYFYAMWQAIIYTITIDNTNTTTSTNSLSILYGSSATVTVTPTSGYYLSSVSCPSGVSCTGYSTGESYTGAQTVTITNNTATTSSGTLSFVAEEPKVYMQDMTLADCPTSGAKVYDKRDESSYTVKKLADGYCWMTQNLALDLTALTQAQLYGTGTNAGKLTNASNTTLGYLKGTTTGTTSDKYPTAKLNNDAWTSSSQNYYSIPMMVSSGTCNNAYCTNSNLSWSYTDTLAATINGATSRVQGKIGIYYNYCAASAGSYCYGNGTSAGTSSGNASEDICPYGWHLPAGDTAQGSFYYLYNTGYSANYNNFVVALSTPLSGYFYSGKAYNQGNYGYFWSSTRYNNYNMYRLRVDSSSVRPQSDDYRYYGYSVRCVKEPTKLYNTIAAMSKGKQTAAQLQAAITVPTSADRTQDTSNSGVYEYDPSVFGTSSDASNDYKIYYYRGVLENTLGSYGSNGSAVTYPNYVILDADGNKTTSDTCWRIVRTTGSGGVKMIYNGKWTGSTCANATTNAQVTTQAFGLKGNSAQSTWYYNINRVGYTFNNTQSLQDSTTATDVNTVFGSDSSPSTNNERSNIKKYIEDTWYASNMTAWTSKLEASAGYCNDRSAFSNNTGATALTTIPPYATSSASMYFGAYARNMNSAKTPSLTCPRSTVDLYRYVSGSTGVSNELKYPVALITADEASFAGSGSSTATNGSSYNANSYLRAGSSFWLLSPNVRGSYGNALGFRLDSDGRLYNYNVYYSIGVRPAISLVSGTTISGGSGIATDPWVVQP